MKYKVKTTKITLDLACEPGAIVSDSSTAVEVARAFFATLDADVEHFVVLALDNKGRVIGVKETARGSATATLVHPREIFRAALHLGAVRLIVVHNHPSGDPTPSPEDVALTKRLKAAGELLGIPVLDSIVLGDGYRSIG